jgi:nucleoside phosphorylase
MFGIHYATKEEARPYLRLSGAIKVTAEPFALFKLKTIPVIIAISGMGKVSAALATQILIREHKCKHILNAGVCGALIDNAGFDPGKIFGISKVSEGPPGPGIPSKGFHCTGTFWPDASTARLVTVEQPVFSSADRQRWASWGDLVDMEGAIVARVAHLYNIPWNIIKGVTDMAGDGDRNMLHRNLEIVSEAIATQLNNGLAEYATT